MQILYIFIGLSGLTMVLFGSKWMLRLYKAKDVVEFSLTESQKDFEINKKGLYSISFIGGWSAKILGSFKVRVLNVDEKKEIQVIKNTLKPQIRRKTKRGIELFKFNIQEEGEYRIEFFNQEDLKIKRSNLFPFQLIEKSKKVENIEVLIKETIVNWKMLLGIVFLVFGVNMLAWGMTLGINPNLFR